MLASKDQGTEFEFTVVQKLNQGCPGNGGNYCRVSFLDRQKRKYTFIESKLLFNSISWNTK